MNFVLSRLGSRYGVTGPVIRCWEVPCLLIAAGLVAVIAYGVLGGIIDWDSAGVTGVYLSAVALWFCGAASEAIGFTRIGQGIRLSAMFALLAFSTAWASNVLAVVSLPYVDQSLVDADRALGVDWLTMIAGFRRHPEVLTLLSHAYMSLSWQPMVLLSLLALFRAPQRGWRFLAAWGLALAGCLIVFPFCPAVGGYVHFGIPQESMPNVLDPAAWRASLLLDGLRDGTIDRVSSATIGGIITMPSFHVASAVLLAWGFMSFKWIRWPFLLLNAAMLVSSVPIGGHYLLDVLAGSLVALVSIILAQRWVDALSHRWHGPPAEFELMPSEVATAP